MLNHKALIRVWIILMLTLTVAGASFAQLRDSDGDGIPDGQDNCPNAAGPTWTFGCPENSDNNNNGNGGNNSSGDDNDNRANEPASPNIPPPDTDGDGTADPQDNCPNLPGNGANYGCPEGQTSEAQSESSTETQQPFVLIPILDDGDCSLAAADNFRINVRRDPDPESPIIGVIEPNEILPIGGIYYPSSTGPRSELEPEGNQKGPWYMPVPEDGSEPGWVAGSVIRTGGADCEDFDLPENHDTGEDYLLIKLKPVYITSYQTGGSGDGDVDGRDFLIWQRNYGAGFDVEIRGLTTTDEAGDVVPTDSFSLNFGAIKFEYKPQRPDSSAAHVDFYLRLQGVDGEATDTSNGDGSTTIEYCVYLEVQEAGVFEEVCYQIEIPENCTLTSSEAGVYNVECEGEAEIELNPAIEGLPAANITIPENDEQGVLMALLLPAVQN
jgi:hypothetical protein